MTPLSGGRKINQQDYNIIDGEFQHIVLEGTAYEVGKMQGEALKSNREMRLRIEKTISSYLTQLGFRASEKLNPEEMGFQDSQQLQSFFEDHCPGLNEEMRGFADGLGVEAGHLPYYCAAYVVPKRCSQVVSPSSTTLDKHVYVSRSYEWTHTEEDLRLCTTRVKGKAKHIGFSIFLFGRADGINEHGVSASFTGGGVFGVPYTHRGFENHVVIRSILENCRSVSDAMEYVQNIPISGYFTLLIADRNSDAALLEFADGACDVKRMNNDTKDQCLFSTNHYTLPATVRYNELNCGIIDQSKRRYQLLASALKKAAPHISTKTLKALLSKKFPEGVCDHYYSNGFGTVWSAIFDLTSAKADICFGAPTHNKWLSFTLDGSVGVRKYQAVFPDITGKWPY